ncbi:MAG TPA: heavy metal translocating P-type ATPase [Terriglobales bacterium]|nr:heavy metal translocating P-type ATPase [Terriglobales bacterium]
MKAVVDAPHEFRIHGMDCAEEVAILKREIGPLVGAADNLAFDILRGKMTVLPGALAVDPKLLVQAVGRTGMRAEPWVDPVPDAAKEGFWPRRGRTALTASSGVFLIAGVVVHTFVVGGFSHALGSEGMGASHDVPLVSRILYLMAIVSGGWYVLPKGWFAARRLRPDMNLLMTLAVGGAVGIGEWFEAATVAFLFALSLALESWSVGRARRAVEALIAISPPTVRLLDGTGHEQEMSPADVLVGQRFIVRPGERIPLDGMVIRGSSEVNQAPITGESLPVLKEEGAAVFAGTVNGDGALEVEATKLAGETTLAQIIRMVGEAQSRRAPSEQWVDRFAQVYTPAILAIAVLVAVIPPLFVGQHWSEWVYRSLVLLVIGCPCALVISTPVSIVAALASAARNGILVKGGVHMETPARLRALALDKTGTVTVGKPEVVSVVAMNGHSEDELLERVGALEFQSGHPLARATVDYVRRRGIDFSRPEDFQSVTGKGATALLNGKRYWLGSHRYLEERGQETSDVHALLEHLSNSGRTVIIIGNDEHVCGFIALADTVRPGAADALGAVRQQGIKHIVMLTGDNRGTAEVIAQQAGIHEVRAELLPSDKVTAVENLVRDFECVAMVGDGINDAPAMGRATLAIAMGAAGSDTAIEAADVALMADDLGKIPWLIRHSRRTLAIIRQNIAASLLVKAAFMVLTFWGHASLWAAIAADMGVSLLVIANALRLLKGGRE